MQKRLFFYYSDF